MLRIFWLNLSAPLFIMIVYNSHKRRIRQTDVRIITVKQDTATKIVMSLVNLPIWGGIIFEDFWTGTYYSKKNL